MLRKYGWRPDIPDHRDFRLAAAWVDDAHLPTSVDMSGNFCPVWDQGELGSCTGHGIGAAVWYMNHKAHPQWDFAPSRLFIYYNERSIEGTIDQDAGALIRDGIKSVAKYGVCREDLWTYDTNKFKDKPTAAAFSNALKHTALHYQRVPQVKNGIKTVLASGYPMVFGFSVYDYFESQEMASTGVLHMPTKTEKLLGGHAVCAVGYDANYILVRNSWGASWGLNGYFKMPWSYILNGDLADDLWIITTMQ